MFRDITKWLLLYTFLYHNMILYKILYSTYIILHHIIFDIEACITISQMPLRLSQLFLEPSQIPLSGYLIFGQRDITYPWVTLVHLCLRINKIIVDRYYWLHLIILCIIKFKFTLKINKKLAKKCSKNAEKQVFLRFPAQYGAHDDFNTILD